MKLNKTNGGYRCNKEGDKHTSTNFIQSHKMTQGHQEVNNPHFATSVVDQATKNK